MIAPRYIRLARSDEHLDPRLLDFAGKSAEELRCHLVAETARLGYRVVERRKSIRKPGRATTLRRKIWMPYGYNDWPPSPQCRYLAHELVHARQWHCVRAFGLRYLLAEYRWAVEVQAYRESVRVRWVQGHGMPTIRAWCAAKAKAVPSAYSLGRLKDAEEMTLAMLLDEVERLNATQD